MASLRFGLRAQIVFALLIVFVISFPLLGVATVRLTQAAAGVEQQRASRAQLGAIAVAIERGPRDAVALDRLFDDLEAFVTLRAVRIERMGQVQYERGAAPASGGTSIALLGGGTLRVWIDNPRSPTRMQLGNLLLFYVSITGLAVMVLTYFALTYWIVRPLGRLTRFSEQLAAGAADVRVPESGAAEVSRLASAFNQMATQLRDERHALVARLAELEHRTTELKNTQQQLIHGEKLASVGRLAAGVAHEIGNPLSAILGLVELLRAGGLPPETNAEFLARIESETERIHRIIRDLLDFSRRDVEDESIDQRSDLAQVIDDALKLIKPQKASQRVDIHVDLDPQLGPVMGPPHRLRQVILNLLLNSIDALEGRGTIRIEARRDPDRHCVLTVTDDGPGLPELVREHLFEPFTTTKPPGKGTGLGLAVCHALITGMGGTIGGEVLPEGGSRFRVRLRLA
jgi:signal transduction histidine kinase